MMTIGIRRKLLCAQWLNWSGTRGIGKRRRNSTISYAVVLRTFLQTNNLINCAGMYIQTLSCRACGHSSYTFDAFTQLALELPPEGLQTDLNDCLNVRLLLGLRTIIVQAHFCEENLPLEMRWRCENCQDYRAAVKKQQLWHMPDVLFIQLKRFVALGRVLSHKRLVQIYAYVSKASSECVVSD